MCTVQRYTHLFIMHTNLDTNTKTSDNIFNLVISSEKSEKYSKCNYGRVGGEVAIHIFYMVRGDKFSFHAIIKNIYLRLWETKCVCRDGIFLLSRIQFRKNKILSQNLMEITYHFKRD